MYVGCPCCATEFRVDETRMCQEVMTVRCAACRSLFRVTRSAGGESSLLPAGEAHPPRVLIAHGSPPFCEAVRTLLSAEPWEITVCHDGVSALELLRRRKISAALLDVALPGRYGFELCEELRSQPLTAGIKLLLFASIYDKSRYKRLPRTLYGADDYIEQHHIPDLLLGKVRALLSGGPAVTLGDRRKSPAPEPTPGVGDGAPVK